MSLARLTYLIFLVIFSFAQNPALSQVFDTIANWDGINVEWTISAGGGEVVENLNSRVSIHQPIVWKLPPATIRMI